MEQVNEVVNNVTACLGAVLPLEEATDALKKITASEKMLKDDEASIKTEYIHSSKQHSERSVSQTQIPSKSSKTVHDIIVDVSRSISHVSSVRESSVSTNLPKSVAEVPGLARSHGNASAKSDASKNSTKSAEAEVAEVPVARSRSSVSVKSWASKKSSKSVDDAVSSRSSASIKIDAVSKTSTKSNEENSEVEESSDIDVDKTSSSILNQVKLIDLTSESHIAVSYGSAEEEKTVVKNTQHKRWPKIGKSIAVVCIFCALALVSYTVITVGGLNRNQSQSSQEQFLTNNDEPTFSPTFSPTYYTIMPTYAPTPDDGEGIATEKDRKQSSQEQILVNDNDDEPTFSPTYYTNMPTYAPTPDDGEEIATGKDRKQSSHEQFLTNNDEPTFSPTYYTNMPTYAPTRDATEEIATGKDWKGKKGEAV